MKILFEVIQERALKKRRTQYHFSYVCGINRVEFALIVIKYVELHTLRHNMDTPQTVKELRTTIILILFRFVSLDI